MMVQVIGIVLIAVTICVVEIPKLIKQKFWKELIVFMFVLLIGVGLSLYQVL